MVELMSSVLENSRKSERCVHYVLALHCVKVAEPERNIYVGLYPPFHFWQTLLKQLMEEPFSKHHGGNTLQAVTLAFHKLGYIP